MHIICVCLCACTRSQLGVAKSALALAEASKSTVAMQEQSGQSRKWLRLDFVHSLCGAGCHWAANPNLQPPRTQASG